MLVSVIKAESQDFSCIIFLILLCYLLHMAALILFHYCITLLCDIWIISIFLLLWALFYEQLGLLVHIEIGKFSQKLLLAIGEGLLLIGCASIQLYETMPNCIPKWMYQFIPHLWYVRILSEPYFLQRMVLSDYLYLFGRYSLGSWYAFFWLLMRLSIISNIK